MEKKKAKRKSVLATTEAKQRKFLAAFVACEGAILRACAAAGINRSTHKRWLDADPAYAAAFDDAKGECLESLELEARRRALHGVRKYKFHMGAPVMVPCDPMDPEGIEVGQSNDGSPIFAKHYYEHEYSDTLAIFLLKALDPDKYRENTMGAAGAGEAPEVVVVVVDTAEDAQKAMNFGDFAARLQPTNN